jgi:hypothetical protein
MLTMKNKKLVIKYQKVKDEYKVINTKFVFCEEMKQKYRQLYKNALDPKTPKPQNPNIWMCE